MNKERTYKTIGDFYKTEKENNYESKCIDYFIRRKDDDSYNIKNIGDINKINNNLIKENYTSYKNIISTQTNYPLSTNNIKKNTYNPNYATQLPIYQTPQTQLPTYQTPQTQLPTYQTQLPIYQTPQNETPIPTYPISQTQTPTYPIPIFPMPTFEQQTSIPKIIWENKFYENTSLPEVFGPPMWFTLHNGSSKYPENPSNLIKKRMINFILGIPAMIPCHNCQEHATNYIEKNKNKLDEICSSKDNLFKFFVDFHNFVNKRLGKKIFNYDQAYKLYNGNIEIIKMSYS